MKRKLGKKITLYIISLFMICSLTSCANDESVKVEPENVDVAETNTPEVTVSNDDQKTENTDDTQNTNDGDANVTEDPDTITEQPETVDIVTEDPLTQTQKNSVAMLNYLAATSQEIEDTKNNRVYLEEVYSALINNTNPDKIDKTTQDHLTNLLDIIDNYRMISIKRDRLQYLYEQDKASTIRKAVPNPLAVLSVANALDWKRLVASVIYTAVASYNNYKNAEDELDKQFMISGWELDDKEAENIHKNRKRTFNYMINIVRENNLPGNLALSESAIEQFTKYINTENVYQRLQFLESEQNTYQSFGSYWLEIADCYYELEDYKNFLKCFGQYENLYTGIFRKDYSYAERLPKAIVAAQSVYTDNDEYVETIVRYTDSLVKNTENTDWSLRYFAAQSYIDLYSKTNNDDYLEKAYLLVLDNVNQLIDSQKEVNETYLSDVKELKLPDAKDMRYASDADKKAAEKERKAEQKRLDKYNKSLKEKRKKELPSLYEPLILNCDLLFSLAEQLNVSDKEKRNIEGMLQTSTNGVFISKPINDIYSFTHKNNAYEIQLTKDKIVIPADMLVEGSLITVAVNNSEGSKKIEDITVNKVERPEQDISTFKAYATSKSFKGIKWTEDSKVEISITNGDHYEPMTFNFKVTEIRNNFILPDEVIFECTD